MCCTRTIAPTWWMSLNPTSSADSSSCVATAMWRSAPGRSSSSCSDRRRPTESGMKIRGKTTVDLSGSTGRCEGTIPSRFTAGISLTATQYSPEAPELTSSAGSGGGPELPGTEDTPPKLATLPVGVLAESPVDLLLRSCRQIHCVDLPGWHRGPGASVGRRAHALVQVPD